MVPVLAALVGAFPFASLGFHADNGSEYINHRVAAMLNKLHVEEFTKSRPRRSNDNALVESKNGNVVRRWLGHSHIPEHLAPPANAFLRDFLSPFLNHHRACLFAVEVEESNGRRRRKYPQELVMTPLREAQIAARSRWLPEAGHHLRATRRRSTCRHRPGGCPGSPAWPARRSFGSSPRRSTPQRDPSRRPLGSLRLPPGVAATLHARSANPKIDASINPHLRTPPRPLHAHVRVGKVCSG